MPGLNDLKRRIKSVQNTRQVTKAMQAVSASKMRKAVDRAVKSREYSRRLWEMVASIRSRGSSHHPLLQTRDVKHSVGILMTSDKGLCGGLNANVINIFLSAVEDRERRRVNAELIGIGKKGDQQLRRHGKILIAAYEGLSDEPDIVKIRGLARDLLLRYEKKEIDEVFVAFTDFESMLKQYPRVLRVLPFGHDPIEFEGNLKSAAQKEDPPVSVLPLELLFEPNTEFVLRSLLPRLLEVELYQLLLESSASEHSGRMMAMSNATKNATEMIDELKLTYNQARQASITQEIAEIAAGRAALESI